MADDWIKSERDGKVTIARKSSKRYKSQKKDIESKYNGILRESSQEKLAAEQAGIQAKHDYVKKELKKGNDAPFFKHVVKKGGY